MSDYLNRARVSLSELTSHYERSICGRHARAQSRLSTGKKCVVAAGPFFFLFSLLASRNGQVLADDAPARRRTTRCLFFLFAGTYTPDQFSAGQARKMMNVSLYSIAAIRTAKKRASLCINSFIHDIVRSLILFRYLNMLFILTLDLSMK